MYNVAIEPLGHAKRRFDGSYTGLNQSGLIASTPLSPSTTMSRASAAVADTIAPRLPGMECALNLAHSVILLVLPKPRPAKISQVDQSPAGGNCFGRAQNDQRYSRYSLSLTVGAASLIASRRSETGSKAIEAANDSSCSLISVLILNRAIVRAGQLRLIDK